MRRLLFAILLALSAVEGVPADLRAEAPAGTRRAVALPIRLESKYMAPLDQREKDGRIGTVTAYVRDGRIQSSERARFNIRVDGVTVTVEFEVRSIEHPERSIAYVGVTHEYQMRLLRFQHGYRRSEKDAAYYWDADSDDPDKKLDAMPEATGKEMDAFLQRGVELWVDRALSLILLNLEQDFKNSKP